MQNFYFLVRNSIEIDKIYFISIYWEPITLVFDWNFVNAKSLKKLSRSKFNRTHCNVRAVLFMLNHFLFWFSDYMITEKEKIQWCDITEPFLLHLNLMFQVPYYSTGNIKLILYIYMLVFSVQWSNWKLSVTRSCRQIVFVFCFVQNRPTD